MGQWILSAPRETDELVFRVRHSRLLDTREQYTCVTALNMCGGCLCQARMKSPNGWMMCWSEFISPWGAPCGRGFRQTHTNIPFLLHLQIYIYIYIYILSLGFELSSGSINWYLSYRRPVHYFILTTHLNTQNALFFDTACSSSYHPQHFHFRLFVASCMHRGKVSSWTPVRLTTNNMFRLQKMQYSMASLIHRPVARMGFVKEMSP